MKTTLISRIAIGVGIIMGTVLHGQNLVQSNTPNALSVPNRVSMPFEPGKTNYTIIFGISNVTAIAKRIVSHQVSCGCEKLQASQLDFAPGATGKIKVFLNTMVPTVKAVYLIDESTNWYATQIAVTNTVTTNRPAVFSTPTRVYLPQTNAGAANPITQPLLSLTSTNTHNAK